MGPDEFHDGSPDLPGSGLVNNTYTNVMAAWALARALDAVAVLDEVHGGDLRDRLDLRSEELARWDEITRRLTVEFDREGRLAPFRGYDDLSEFDWDRYRTMYGNIGRLDLILEAEGDTTNRYKLSKQADLLMLFYLFSADELTAILTRLGYRFDPATIPDTVRYQLARTSHGSTLSRVAHAWVLARTDRERSWRLFLEALASDIDDTQEGTTGEGIHLGAMAGTVDLLQRCYSGVEFREQRLHINPRLPDELKRLRFEILFRGHRLELDMTHTVLTIRSRPARVAPIETWIVDEALMIAPGEMHRRELHAPARTGGSQPT
jgi:trehalose/maltose hydrolase-like predicted phosphorylase